MRNWDGDHWGPYRPVPYRRFPLLRDAITVGMIGAFLGGAVGFRVVRGEWPVALSLAAVAAGVYLLVVAIGQFWRPTRLTGAQLLRLALTLVATTAIVLVLTLLILD
ncbi:MAG: hypothetical protein R3290_01335 [Acidimicrobiia bacterium]|nr:hypothetical protein [Acidimicrobiia bacterium]